VNDRLHAPKPAIAFPYLSRSFGIKLLLMKSYIRDLSNLVALAGAFAWAALAIWHAGIVVQCGWPEPFMEGHLFMMGPAIALAIHATIFSWRRIRQSYCGLVLETLSLIPALMLIYFEASARFIGYK